MANLGLVGVRSGCLVNVNGGPGEYFPLKGVHEYAMFAMKRMWDNCGKIVAGGRPRNRACEIPRDSWSG